MAGQPTLYNLFFRNNFVMLGSVFATAFGLSMTFDLGSQRLWDNMNRGRQWKDIKSKYIEAGAEDDDE
ncbi:ubiquinol-cytochrome C reductase [Coniella lustricola]|uniref:Complex III subunit 9 n=1 Tax=Coniella lustricola TaxID=2025994 RepID=A0A2T3AMR6_9PEZI|nr:ubiquinol-cytochrome C reductase [Coniella lustricola]